MIFDILMIILLLLFINYKIINTYNCFAFIMYDKTIFFKC